jgi:hypothetical protein
MGGAGRGGVTNVRLFLVTLSMGSPAQCFCYLAIFGQFFSRFQKPDWGCSFELFKELEHKNF